MPKRRKETRLSDEMKVLDALEQDAKENIDEIAKRCGFSRQKVWRIIKELEQRKVIWGYTAITDEETKNLKHFLALVKRNTIPFDEDVKKEIMYKKLDDVIPDLIKIENIYLTHGCADLVFTFYAKDLISAKKFVECSFKRHSKYIQEYYLVETLFPIRKQGLKNPRIQTLVQYF